MYKRSEIALIVLVFFGSLISYMDRAVFGVLAPQIERDLGLNAFQMGVIFSMFSVGYTSAVLFGGYFADRLGTKRVISWAMAAWSVFCAATGAVTGFASALVIRLVFGAAESPWVPSWHKHFYRWFSGPRYTGAASIAMTGTPFGGAVAAPLAAGLAAAFGWRMAFVLIGALGLVWLVAWRLLAREQPDGEPAGANPARTAAVAEDASGPSAARSIFNVPVMSIIVAQGAYGYIIYFFISWFPSYLAKTLKLSATDLSLANAAPWIGGVFGLLAGGFATDLLVRRVGVLAARKLIIAVSLIAAAVAVTLVPLGSSPTLIVLLMVTALFFVFFSGPSYGALIMDLTPRRHHGIANGAMVLATSVGGIVAPIVTGAIVQVSESFTVAFWATGAVLAVGAAAIFLCHDRDRPAEQP